MANIGLYSFLAYVVASLTYAYKFRGKTRYDSFIEYIRKGWPLTTPMNVLLYIFTKERARKPIQSVVDFPELKVIEENWQTIRDEEMQITRFEYVVQVRPERLIHVRVDYWIHG